MKIIKAYKSKDGHLYLMVDNIPKKTYEKIGSSYVGSDDEGYFNSYLAYDPATPGFKAFAGREIEIELKDGTIAKLKDHWWDSGNYDKEHEYVPIGLGTLERLQECYVYCGYNIRKDKLEILLEEYLQNNNFEDYWEIEKWCNLQYTWHPLIFHGKKIPYLINYRGHIIHEITMQREHLQRNYVKVKNGKWFKLKLFKLQYKENGILIKLEDNFNNIAKESLPDEEYKKYIEIQHRRDSR